MFGGQFLDLVFYGFGRQNRTLDVTESTFQNKGDANAFGPCEVRGGCGERAKEERAAPGRAANLRHCLGCRPWSSAALKLIQFGARRTWTRTRHPVLVVCLALGARARPCRCRLPGDSLATLSLTGKICVWCSCLPEPISDESRGITVPEPNYLETLSLPAA